MKQNFKDIDLSVDERTKEKLDKCCFAYHLSREELVNKVIIGILEDNKKTLN
ncbi:hypothetical protein [Anaerofustis stercorihominis]|uniref:hypothetical protein n=1 Tax=Anaerofustis stercorihominis TaxID=214853 RepID=UPI00214CF99D|nr:hypothetical protein [Anaerofustis stercorihominis]MCR2033629.1 hypothetical protein [Anaerofustis stercorihominis]